MGGDVIRSRMVLGAVVLMFTSGCTSDIFRQFNVDHSPPSSLSLDAKQRIILVTEKGGIDHKARIICAEPSPDIVASIGASGSLMGPGKGESLFKLDAQSAESLTRLTKRNSTIQLLRDALYRACEGYMNGGISVDDYREALLMYDDLVITLLSIEEISQMRRSVVPIADESTKPDVKRNVGDVHGHEVDNGAAEIRAIVLQYLANQMELYRWEREDRRAIK